LLAFIFSSLHTDLEHLSQIAVQILEQKALCQNDPDQEEGEEAPEDQAEYDSVLISSAGDLVSSLANALGADFGKAFGTFFPLIAKYYVSFAHNGGDVLSEPPYRRRNVR
jgi:hypothetical protein